MGMKNLTDNRTLLIDAGLRVTAGRLAVLEVLQVSSKPLSLQEILKKIQAHHINQATVYRILESFKKRGLVQTTDLGHGHAHWELTGHHHHLVCEKCGKVENLPECDLHHAQTKIQNKSGYSQLRHTLEFFGLCPECATN